MNFAASSLKSLSRRPFIGVRARAAARSPRLWVYLGCSIAALVTSYLLGKDEMWDTLAYHLYAGFSALHDRFGQDYFAAGTQSYFNPYIYVPYYLLARSGLSALSVSFVLALVQSGILWLTYELALSVVPVERRATRTALAVCAVVLAFANPILINQIGTSYIDILTGELVLAGWLLLMGAVRSPSLARILCAGLVLGAVSALKLTNAVHAVAACVLLVFVPVPWSARLRYAAAFGLALAVSFLLVMVPWSIHLERHFGNPLFPLFNGLFRSPQFPASSLRDLRFVPDSLRDALWRPLQIAAPVTLTDDEFAAPDIRYGAVMVLALWALCGWVWRRLRGGTRSAGASVNAYPWRPFTALGCAFLLDWSLWLTASGIGRYFIAMACVAAVLVVGLVVRVSAMRPKLGAYLLMAILGAQVFEVSAGATYRAYVPWDGGPPLQVSVPKALRARPELYLSFGEQSLSFLAPFLASRSGLVDLSGDYVLGPAGASGAHLEALIRRYAPHLRVLVLDTRLGRARGAGLPEAAHVNDTLAHFGLRAVGDDCSSVLVEDVGRAHQDVLPGSLPILIPQLQGRMIKVPVSPDSDIQVCRVVPDTGRHTALFAGDRRANLAFDRVEDACPQLFQPPRPVTEDFGRERSGFYRMRKYDDTSLALMIVGGVVKMFDPLRGGPPTILGRERDWDKAPLPLVCGRRQELYYAAPARPAP